MLQPSALDVYAASVGKFTEDLLRPYIERVEAQFQQDPNAARASKEFNDPIWGTVLLTPVELVVLNSPLLQRLRRIRQLGVVHLVYPGANHTRFEHSIGVCHQVGRIARSVNEHAGVDRSKWLFDDRLIQRLRLAGLVHDVGHGVLSHVSEHALRSVKSVNELLLAFLKEKSRPQLPQLSEMAAFYILDSDAFRDLITLAYKVGEQVASPGTAEEIATMVAGLKVSDEFPLLHELISGPFDADKLDYIARDAIMCGVPVVTDVNRLIQKMRALSVTVDELPKHLKQTVDSRKNYVITGISRSGARAIDEVVLARSLMFDKVYRHQKVRAVEIMVESALGRIALANPDNAAIMPLHMTDDEFSSLTEKNVDDLFQGKPGEASSVHDLLQRIRDRRLFVRAYAFRQAGDDETPVSQQERFDERQLLSQLRKPAGNEQFKKLVAAEVLKIHDLVPQDFLTTLGGRDLTAYIGVDPPSAKEDDSKESWAYLLEEDGTVHEVRKVVPDLRAWADAYVNTRDVGYIFAPAELAEAVSIAADVVMLREYSVRPAPRMQVYVKTDGRGGLRAALADAGYWGGSAPRELGPEPPVLRRADARERLERITKQYAGYDGPSAEPSAVEAGGVVTPERVRAFVRQFPDELAPVALAAVQSVKIINRSEANAALRGFIEEHAPFKGAAITPLGDPKDGASVLAYFIGDEARMHNMPVLERSDALLGSGPVVFVDDVVGLGNAAVEFFEGLFGAEPTTKLGQRKRLLLPEELQDAFRKREIAIVFCAGLDGGAEFVKSKLAALGVENVTVYVHHPESWIPSIEENVRPDFPSLTDRFIEECRRIGVGLVDGEQDWAQDKKDERVLGYGNRGKLLISSFNTPTMTLTALWKEGTVDGIRWQPLLPRRAKS